MSVQEVGPSPSRSQLTLNSLCCWGWSWTPDLPPLLKFWDYIYTTIASSCPSPPPPSLASTAEEVSGQLLGNRFSPFTFTWILRVKPKPLPAEPFCQPILLIPFLTLSLYFFVNFFSGYTGKVKQFYFQPSKSLFFYCALRCLQTGQLSLVCLSLVLYMHPYTLHITPWKLAHTSNILPEISLPGSLSL